MSTFGGPRIVTDGLVLYLDAANTKSYPGTGTLWKDLSKKSNDWTIPSNSLLDNSINFVNNSAQINADNDWSTNIKELTIECIYNPISTYTGCCDTIFGTYYFRFFQIGTSLYTMIGFGSGGTFVTYQHPAFEVSYGRYHHIVGMRRNDRYIIWIDGVEMYNTNFGSGNDLWELYNTWQLSAPTHPNIKIAEVRIYNRGLTDSELTQNFSATKYRFNL